MPPESLQEESLAACFRCHLVLLVTDPSTSTLTLPLSNSSSLPLTVWIHSLCLTSIPPLYCAPTPIPPSIVIVPVVSEPVVSLPVPYLVQHHTNSLRPASFFPLVDEDGY